MPRWSRPLLPLIIAVISRANPFWFQIAFWQIAAGVFWSDSRCIQSLRLVGDSRWVKQPFRVQKSMAGDDLRIQGFFGLSAGTPYPQTSRAHRIPLPQVT